MQEKKGHLLKDFKGEKYHKDEIIHFLEIKQI